MIHAPVSVDANWLHMSERRNRTTPLREEMDNARQPHLGVGPCRIPFFAQFGLRGSSGHTPTIWSACRELEDTVASTSRPDTVAALVLAKCPHIPWPSRGGVRHFQNATTHPGFTTQDHVEQKASTAQLYVGQCLLWDNNLPMMGARSVSEHITFGLVVCAGQTVVHSLPCHSKTAAHPECSLVQMFPFPASPTACAKTPAGPNTAPRGQASCRRIGSGRASGAVILLAIVYVGRKWPFASLGGGATR